MSLTHYLAIGAGGALGAVSRVGLTKILPETLFGSFPFQIFAVNVVGCFVMGFLVGLMTLYISPHYNLKSFMTTGFLGGFTTFSTFAMETYLLADKNMYSAAFFYMLASVVCSLLVFLIGMKIVRAF